MKKSLLFLVLCGTLLLTATAYGAGPQIFIDGIPLYVNDGDNPFIEDGRTFIPFRVILESFGASLDWDAKTQTVTATLADTVVEMAIGSKTAVVNDEQVEMEVAALIRNERTYVPLRYLAEFFKQKVEWDAAASAVRIVPDYELTKDLAWYITCLNANATNRDLKYDPSRPPQNFTRPAGWNMYKLPNGTERMNLNRINAQDRLHNDWNADDRDGVLQTLVWLYSEGHREGYEQMREIVSDMSDEEIQTLLASGEIDKESMNRIEVIRAVEEKWGDAGILAWDMCRVSQVAGWAYIAGYLSYDEYIEVCLPAAQVVQAAFDGWEDMDLNYIYGFAFWRGMPADFTASTNWELQQRLDTHKKIVSDLALFPAWDMPLGE